MPHNGARDRQWPDRTLGARGRSAEGVMVRRPSVASLDSGAESPVYGEEPSATADRMGPEAKPPWSGGGGRWTVWPMRVVLWAAILIIGYRGVTAIIFNETPSGASPGNDTGAAASAPGFPVELGEAFALRFGEVYLNYSPDTATQRAQQLADRIQDEVEEHEVDDRPRAGHRRAAAQADEATLRNRRVTQAHRPIFLV